MNIEQIRKNLPIFTSDDDLKEYIGSGRENHIILYSSIEDHNRLEELLPKETDFKIILIESKEKSGHWVLLLRSGDTVEYYNSYGERPSKEIDFNSDSMNDRLDQDAKHLNLLINKAVKNKRFRVVYNKRRFQKMDKNVATCGLWVVLRLIMFLEKGMNILQFGEFVNRMMEKTGLTSDELVVFLVNKHVD